MIRYAVILALLTVVGATAFRQPSWILHYASGSFLFGCLFLFFAVMPWGRIVLGDRNARIPFLKYLSLLTLGQLALGFLSFTTAVAFIQTGPKFTEDFFVLKEAQEVLSQHYPCWGIFPWGLFGLWGLMIAYVHYNKGEYPLISNAIYVFFQTRYQPVIKGAIEYIQSTATLFCLSFSMSGAIVLLSFFVEHQLGVPLHVKTSLITLMLLSGVCSLILNILRSKFFLKWGQKVSFDKIPWMMLAIMLPIFVFSAFLGQWALAHMPQEMAKLHGSCLYPEQSIAISTRIASLFWGWCLLWVPLAGSFIARLSKGRTIQEVVVGVLFLPLIVWCLRGQILNIEIPSMPVYSGVYVILSILTLILVSQMMLGMKNNLFLYTGLMPISSKVKTSRVDVRYAPKLSGLQKSFIMIVMSILSAFLTHLLGGWFLIAFQFLAVATFMMSLLYMGLIFASVYLFVKKKKLVLSNH